MQTPDNLQWTREEIEAIEAGAAARGMPVVSKNVLGHPRTSADTVMAEFPWSEVDKPSLRVLAWHSFVMQGRATREDFERTYGAASSNTIFLTKRLVRFTMKDQFHAPR